MSTSGASTGPEAQKRRNYTPDQHKAVVRVMKCSATAYYEILDVQKSCTDTQVKKAYRKLALVMHPDKNAAPQADEAFKRVSKAFQVLSDPDKKRIFDQTGSDPESRGAGFSGFSRGGGARQADFDPNDIFNMFFGGGGGSPFGAQMGGGPQVFTFGGNSFQFGGSPFGGGPFGGGPFTQRTQTGQQARDAAGGGAAGNQAWTQWLPMVGFLVIMMLVQLFQGSNSPSVAQFPKFSFETYHPFVQERHTPNYKVQYFVNPKDVKSYNSAKLRRLDRYAETQYINALRTTCDREYTRRQNALRDAQGWFGRDEEAYDAADNMAMPACEKLDDLGLLQRY